MREVAAAVATAVAEVAYRQGHATKPQPGDLQQAIARTMYQPRYVGWA
jgi:malic enzyme